MTNNDIFRRIRNLFGFTNIEIIALFKLANCDVEKLQVLNWLKKEDDTSFVAISDKQLATFLNGFIIEKRGRREGPQPEPEDPLTNNMILWKLKIALNLKTEDILDLYDSIDHKISKDELSAFLRNPKHKLYRTCMDQYLRRFFNALQHKYSKK